MGGEATDAMQGLVDLSGLAVLGPDEFDALDAILDDLRGRSDETPQWEFCEGFMVALICCRRAIEPDEFLPVLLDSSVDLAAATATADCFASAQQFRRFMHLWNRRWSEIVLALDADIDSLDDARAYQPEILDIRGAVAALSAEQRLELQDQPLPALAQVWALGFMFAVETWPEEWQPPRDRKQARLLNEALDALVALTEDDDQTPSVSVYSEEGPASVSRQRVDALGEALWAVQELRALWRSIGPRVATVRSESKPGRNDPCPCGSGKKYKKCHGAG